MPDGIVSATTPMIVLPQARASLAAGGRRGSTRLASYEVWLPHAQRKARDDLEKIRPVVDGPADAAER